MKTYWKAAVSSTGQSNSTTLIRSTNNFRLQSCCCCCLSGRQCSSPEFRSRTAMILARWTDTLSTRWSQTDLQYTHRDTLIMINKHLISGQQNYYNLYCILNILNKLVGGGNQRIALGCFHLRFPEHSCYMEMEGVGAL